MTQNTHSRRYFLQLSGASLMVAPWLASCASASGGASEVRAIGQPFPERRSLPEEVPPPPNEGSVGFAVIGLGDYALGLAMPGLVAAPRCHVAAVVSGNPEKAARVAAAYGVPEDAIYSYEDFDRIAEDDRVEAVYIVLPTGLHATWTEKSFAAGKHVLCEKPMAISSAECQRMIDAAEKAGKKLMIAYRCHFEPYNLKAMELMQDGAVGSIQTIETENNYTAGPATPATNWRHSRALAGGGPLEDYGLYGLQATMYLTGELPVSVKATTEQPEGDPRFTEIFSTVRAELRFPSGAVGNVMTSYNAPGSNMVSVEGSEGSLLMRPATGYGGNNMTLTRDGASEDLRPGDSSVQFAGECNHFADAIRDGVEIKTGGDMGLRDIRIIEAIYESAASGQEVML